MAKLGYEKIEVEANIYRADGTLKSSETYVADVPTERYEQLKKDGMIK